jgi:hypothetical protein
MNGRDETLGHPLVDYINHPVRQDQVIVRNIDSFNIRCGENEVEYCLEGGESEQGDRGDQKNDVSRITRPVQKNVDANAEENQIYAWGLVDQYEVGFGFLNLKARLVTIKKSADLWDTGMKNEREKYEGLECAPKAG